MKKERFPGGFSPGGRGSQGRNHGIRLDGRRRVPQNVLVFRNLFTPRYLTGDSEHSKIYAVMT